MPPNVSSAGRNWDLDYESVQHVRASCSRRRPARTSGSKFELLPAVQLSPSRRNGLCSPSYVAVAPLSPGGDVIFLAAASPRPTKLEMVTEMLGGDAVNQSFICDPDDRDLHPKRHHPGLHMEAASRGQHRKSPRLLPNRPGGRSTSSLYLRDLSVAASECIDPSVVFPYPPKPCAAPTRPPSPQQGDEEEEIDAVQKRQPPAKGPNRVKLQRAQSYPSTRKDDPAAKRARLRSARALRQTSSNRGSTAYILTVQAEERKLLEKRTCCGSTENS
ncbi:unnamed protein product [Nyctereutes procyonoides]|uniref:(raccoon dog) hypothetical protein n=1 Tax=Nyctereutes procyonoides TaxID=34880 RepID=A0A811YNZ7_NYCPR|nr:unnamed protein product [Nyctereutes procyonoides]